MGVNKARELCFHLLFLIEQTSLCCDVVDFDGQVIAIVAGPRDARHGHDNDEDRLFDKAATSLPLHF
jgi:hypothetical protein